MKAEHKKQLHRLTKENRRIIRKMNRYLSARFLNTVLCRELIFDQIGMALESQKRGTPYTETIGMEPEQYCHALAKTIPRRSFMEILWTLLRNFFAALSVTLPLLFCYTKLFPNYSPISCNGFAMQIPLAWIIKYLLIVSGLILGYKLLRLMTYKCSIVVFGIYFICFMILFIVADNLCLKWVGTPIFTLHMLWISLLFLLLSLFSFSMQYFAALLIAYQKQHDSVRTN